LRIDPRAFATVTSWLGQGLKGLGGQATHRGGGVMGGLAAIDAGGVYRLGPLTGARGSKGLTKNKHPQRAFGLMGHHGRQRGPVTDLPRNVEAA
jgi:hypothetical protein